MFCSHDVCVAWAHLRLTSLELVVHVGIKFVVPISQPEQNILLWSIQFVKAVIHVLSGAKASYRSTPTMVRRLGDHIGKKGMLASFAGLVISHSFIHSRVSDGQTRGLGCAGEHGPLSGL